MVKMHLRILMVLGSPASEKSVWFWCSQSVSWHLVSILYETFTPYIPILQDQSAYVGKCCLMYQLDMIQD